MAKGNIENNYRIGDDVPQFYGTHIATPSFNDTRIVASNEDPIVTIEEAQARGFQDPVIHFYPNPRVIKIPSVFSH